MSQTIEWKDPTNEEIARKCPIEDTASSIRLIVNKGEIAVFVHDRKAFDVFREGEYRLTNSNLPFLANHFSKISRGGEKPAKTSLVFMSTRVFKLNFGVRTQTSELAPLMVFGCIRTLVGDPHLFITEVLDRCNAFTIDDVNEQLRPLINRYVTAEMAQYDLTTLFRKTVDVFASIENNIRARFRQIGLNPATFSIEGMDTTEEWRQKHLHKDDAEKEIVLNLIRKGALLSRKVSFEFQGKPEIAFKIAENRVSFLGQIERNERYIEGTFVAHCFHFGHSREGEGHFATAIDVSGFENLGSLTISIYSEDPTIFEVYFAAIRQDVEKHVRLSEESVQGALNRCVYCGADLPIEKCSKKGIVTCGNCSKPNLVPTPLRKSVVGLL
jgi:hypothetical protein